MNTMTLKAPGAGIAGFPERVGIELTPLCNLSCSMCPRHYIKAGDGFMDEVLWRKLIDEVSAKAPQAVILPFWRGESLLHPEFNKLIRYALDKQLRVHISTNGHLVEGESAVTLARCEFVTFSLHTALGFSKAREFVSLKKDGRPTVQISFVEGEKTEEFMKEAVACPDLCGFDGVRLYEEHTSDGVFGKSRAELSAPRVFCPKLTDTLVVAYDGAVSRCNHVWNTEEFSVRDASIEDAWSSAVLRKIREDYPDAYCSPCGQWTGSTRGAAWRKAGGRIEYKEIGPA